MCWIRETAGVFKINPTMSLEYSAELRDAAQSTQPSCQPLLTCNMKMLPHGVEMLVAPSMV